MGMSGGVDSSVTALLLKKRNFDVLGISMTIWKNKPTKRRTGKHTCYGPGEKEDIKIAQEVCDMIGIPFYPVDCSKQYEDMILTYFRKEYLLGRTPNPCVKCNELIKFDTLPIVARKVGLNFDVFATGHYARIEHDTTYKRFLLKKAKDKNKDQSYFLYKLSQIQLSHTIFPLGEYQKHEVKDIARKNGLPVFNKHESQDFYCGDYSELLNVKEKEGCIVDKNGTVLGKHNGIWAYTLGQRRGLGISSSRPLYVVGLDNVKNEVVVGYEEDTYNDILVAKDINWVSIPSIQRRMEVTAKIRSSHIGSTAIIRPIEGGKVYVQFSNPQKSISPGQSVVFYDSDLLLGGGIIHG